MQLKYTGPKPLISQTGIGFDRKKEDKYRYLPFAIYLLKALDHDYLENRAYDYAPGRHDFSGEEMLSTLLHYDASAEADADRSVARTKRGLDDELEHARVSALLSGDERAALISNLKIMYDYRLQRMFNKSLYYSAVRALARVIADKRIRYIKAPFTEASFHVSHTIEGVIRRLRLPIEPTLNIYQDNRELFVQLDFARR